MPGVGPRRQDGLEWTGQLPTALLPPPIEYIEPGTVLSKEPWWKPAIDQLVYENVLRTLY